MFPQTEARVDVESRAVYRPADSFGGFPGLANLLL
jgi:hypothetical protein